MKTIQSSNRVEVAELPYKLNLQYFAEEPEQVDDGVVDLETNDSFDDSMRGEEPEPEAVKEPEKVEDVAEPQKQDSETNKEYQGMRHELKALKEKTQSMDKWVADSYGESHGLKTWEDYQGALAQQAQEAERQDMLDKGVDPDIIEKVVNEKLSNHPAIVAAEKAKADQNLIDNYKELAEEYSDLVKNANDVAPEVWQKWNNGESGMSLTEAYTVVNRKAIMQQTQASTKQKTLNNLNSKSHLSTEGDGAGEVTDVSIPAETLQMYLDQGYSKAEATKFHKKLYG